MVLKYTCPKTVKELRNRCAYVELLRDFVCTSFAGYGRIDNMLYLNKGYNDCKFGDRWYINVDTQLGKHRFKPHRKIEGDTNRNKIRNKISSHNSRKKIISFIKMLFKYREIISDPKDQNWKVFNWVVLEIDTREPLANFVYEHI